MAAPEQSRIHAADTDVAAKLFGSAVCFLGVVEQDVQVGQSWIKMRTNLWTCPKVMRMSAILSVPASAVCGACFVLWSIADDHSVDGVLDGYTPAMVDAVCGVPKFSDALLTIGWLEVTEVSVTITEFHKHNGQSAKARAMNAVSQQISRGNRGGHGLVTDGSRNSVTEARPDKIREEKKREEKKKPQDAAVAATGLPESFVSRPDAVRAFEDWQAYKQERGETYRAKGLAAFISKYAPLGPDRFIAAVRHSMGNNWAGLFEERSGNGQAKLLPTLASTERTDWLRAQPKDIKDRWGEEFEALPEHQTRTTTFGEWAWNKYGQAVPA